MHGHWFVCFLVSHVIFYVCVNATSAGWLLCPGSDGACLSSSSLRGAASWLPRALLQQKSVYTKEKEIRSSRRRM